MTEIHIPGDTAPISPSKGPGMKTILMVVVVLLIIGGAVIAYALLGGGPNVTTTSEPTTTSTTTTVTTTSSNHESILLAHYSDLDPDVYPTYFSGGFELTTDHVDDATPPDILFMLFYHDMGTDVSDVWTYIACFDLDEASFDSMTWTNRQPYLIDEDYIIGTVTHYINLPKTTGDYTWTFYIDDSEIGKSDVWSVNIYIFLRYNWIL